MNDPQIHIYIPSISVLGDLVKFRESFNLLEIKGSGNVHFVIPYYKSSVFKYLQYIKKTAIVSFLQLYLDLHTFSPRGQEQAEYLLSFTKRKKHALA